MQRQDQVECDNTGNEWSAKQEISKLQPAAEAHAALFLTKDAFLCTQSELMLWILKHMFTRISPRDYGHFDLLHVTSKDAVSLRNDPSDSVSPTDTPSGRLSPSPSSAILPSAEEQFLMTPQTHILSVAKEYRKVFLIDLSSSLATIDASSGKIMIGETFTILKNVITGIVQPFTLLQSPVLQPTLNLTVIAECSQFGSNMNVVPILAEYPTMRVLMQNAQVTAANVFEMLRLLENEIQAFQDDLAKFRQKMAKRRAKLGYELDVRSDHPAVVEDEGVTDFTIQSVEPGYTAPTKETRQGTTKRKRDPSGSHSGKLTKSDSSTTNKRSHSTAKNTSHRQPTQTRPVTVSSNPQQNRLKNMSSPHAKKDVWGVGKTGSSLSYILHAGLFALKLLPLHGQPSLVLITDGVVKSNIQDESIIRQLSRDDVTCSIIQMSPKLGFIPGFNFGFVPDNEILQFLAGATSGHFMFAEHCLPYSSDDTTPNILGSSNQRTHRPNIYHFRFLIREIFLDRTHSDARLLGPIALLTEAHKDGRDRVTNGIKGPMNEKGDDSTMGRQPSSIFPWSPSAEPLPTDTRLLRYQEYYLSHQITHVIRARMRQGFTVTSVAFDTKRSRRSNEISDVLKKEQILITLAVQWQPDITIEYRIRASLSFNGLDSAAKALYGDRMFYKALTEEQTTDTFFALLDSIINAKAEILIRASSIFSHMLQNWDAFQRRCQVMGIVTGTVGAGETFGSASISKIARLKKLLVRIAETDDLLKSLVTFDKYRFGTHAADARNMYIREFKAFWSKMNATEFRQHTLCWYDSYTFDLVAMEKYPTQQNIQDTTQDNADVQAVLAHMVNQLEDWATFTEDQVFVKLFNLNHIPFANPSISPERGRRDTKPTADTCPQFCELRIHRDTHRVLSVRILFFNMDVATRREQVKVLKEILTTPSETANLLETLAVGNANAETRKDMYLKITNRPLSTLIMHDAEHYYYKEREQVTDGPNKTWYLNPTASLTGEFVVRNYLRRYTWYWETQDIYSDYARKTDLMSLRDLAFELICHERRAQGFALISYQRSACHFYKEVCIANTSFACQYYVWSDPNKQILVTELSVEPIVDGFTNQIYDSSRTDIFERDKALFTHLITFDQIYAIGQGHMPLNTLEKGDYDPTYDALLNIRRIFQPSLFNLSSVLRSSVFLLATFSCPIQTSSHAPVNPDEKHIVWLENDKNVADANALMPYTTDRTVSRTRQPANVSPGGEARSGQTRRTTTCECPRPDALFQRHKEALSKLPSGHRAMAFLHYYFEQYITRLADNDIALLNMPHDGFWYTLMEHLHSHPLVASSAIPIAQDVSDLRCFVKTIDPSTFVIVLIPSLDLMFQGLAKSDISKPILNPWWQHIEPLDHFALFMFECRRQTPTVVKNHTLGDDTDKTNNGISVRTFVPNWQKESVDTLNTIMQPHITHGYFTPGVNGVSEESEHLQPLMQDMIDIYSRSFVKVVYTSLLRGHPVDAGVFEKILEFCEETTLNIDLTGYLNVQTLLKRRGRIKIDEIELAYERFNSVLGHYFEPVVSADPISQHRIYCYRPPFAKAAIKQGSTTEESSAALADIAVCAQNPLFLRLEYALCKPMPDGKTSEVVFSLDKLPFSYEGITDNGETFNFEPEVIGSQSSPVESPDGTTATLRLICMTLPESQFDPADIIHTHLQGCHADSTVHHQTSFLDAEVDHHGVMQKLTHDKRDALLETKARLTWLLTEEIMHGLLRSGPVTETVVRYIEAQLMRKNPFVDFPTTMFIPLVFVKDATLGRQIFFDQLEKNRSAPYRLIRVGECFYASDHAPYVGFGVDDRDGDLAEGVPYDEGLKITVDVKRKPPPQNGNDEFCQGLGISILEPEAAEDEDIVETEEDPDPMRQQLYWLLIIPQAQNVQIYFYSKVPQSVNRSEIIRVTKAMVNDIMKKSNKLVLLHYMYESSICSKYLTEPGDDSDIQYSSDEFSDDGTEEDIIPGNGDNLVEMLSTSGEEPSFTPPKKFQPGQFACDVLFTRRFPLHWRLQPNSALSILAADVLRPLAVKNRPNMFVYMRDNVVVYYVLYETVTQHRADSDSLADQESHTHRSGSPYGSLSGLDTVGTSYNRAPLSGALNHKVSSPESQASERQSPKNSPSSRQESGLSPNTKRVHRVTETRELVLEVRGVELSSWITDELVDLLENRLTSQITLKEVQQFLSRNPTSKLSRADIEFILPVEKPPKLRSKLRIPAIIADIPQFLSLFRQNILASQLRALNGTDLSLSLKRHRTLRYGGRRITSPWYTKEIKKEPEVPSSTTTDLCFYYNCLNRAPGVCSQFELNVGQGVAGISCTLLDQDDLAKTHIPTQEKFQHSFSDELLADCFDVDLVIGGERSASYKLAIDIWTVGQISTDHLHEHLLSCFQQSICDYIVECVVSETPLMDNDPFGPQNGAALIVLEPLLRVLKKALVWQSPTVKCIQKTVDLYPWCMDDILLQLESELTSIHAAFKPIIARAALSSSLTNKEPTSPAQFDLYYPPNPLVTHQNYPQHAQNSRFLMLSGLSTQMHRVGYEEEEMRQSVDGDLFQRLDTLSVPSVEDEKQRKEMSIASRADDFVHSRQDSVTSGMGRSLPRPRNGFRESAYRCSFLILLMDTSMVQAYAYNCEDMFSDHISRLILRVVTNQETRNRALHNILHQKMGLFHHTPRMSEILCNEPVSSVDIVGKQQPSPTASTIARLGQTGTHIRGISATQACDENKQVNFETLKQVVACTFSVQHVVGGMDQDRDAERPSSIFDIRDASRLCKPATVELDDVFYTATRVSDANNVFRDTYTGPRAEYHFSQHRDALARHGEPFLSTYLRRAQLQAAHEKAFKVYTKWANRYSRGHRQSTNAEMMTVQELKLILKSSRLLHFCRTRLIFSEKDSADGTTEGTQARWLFGDPSTSPDDAMTAWYKHLTSTFMKEYARYLEDIGMHLIVFGPSNDSEEEINAYTSKFNITSDFFVTSPVVYLLQVFNGGTIMCEARLTDTFVFVTLYTLHRRYGRFTYSPYVYEKSETRRASFKDFTEECDKFKQRIHVNSFVFDFHLRHIQRSLDDLASLPSNVHLLNIIKHLTTAGYRPATFSRNRVLYGTYDMIEDEKMDHIVGVLFRDASKFGLKTLTVNQKPTACFVSSNDLSFEESTKGDSACRYTLIISPADYVETRWPNAYSFHHRTQSMESSMCRTSDANNALSTGEKICFHYYVIITHHDKVSSTDEKSEVTPGLWLPRHKRDRSKKGADVITEPGMHTASEVEECAKKRIRKMISKAIFYCRRDADWAKLYEAVNTNRLENTEELIALASRFDTVDVTTADPTFSKFIRLDLRWDNVLDMLKLFYPMTSGDLRLNETRHLLIFLPNAVADYFMHFKVTNSRNKMDVYICRKEKRSVPTLLDDTERAFVSSIATTLSYYIWKRTH